MRTLSTFCVAFGVLVAAMLDVRAEPTTRPAYVGSFEYRYEGFRVRADVPDAKRLQWTILEGGNRVGENAWETVDRRTITPGVEFVSWTEEDGTIVVQVVDLHAMRVTSALIINGKRLVMEGTIHRLPE